jgi:hypothetical protein
MPQAGFEPAVATSELPQTHPLDRAAMGSAPQSTQFGLPTNFQDKMCQFTARKTGDSLLKTATQGPYSTEV